MAGGLFANGTPTHECWRYGPSQDLWTQVADLPDPARHRATCFSDGSYGYLAGGADGAFNPLSETWRYDPVNDTWSALAPLPGPRYGCAVLSDIAFGVVGGASNDTTFHANSYLYDIWTDTWSEETDTLPHALRGAKSAYAIGGGGWYFNVIDTGLDNDLVRRRGMCRYGFVFSVDEKTSGQLRLYPNPSSTHLFAAFPPNWSQASFHVHDDVGRLLKSGSLMSHRPITITELPACRYVLSLVSNGERLRAPFIKLP